MHPHPADFRLTRVFDRGWGEMACRYEWACDDGSPPDAGGALPLAHCTLFEVTTYVGNAGRYEGGWFFPPDPPFPGWRFRDPTDGRTAPVGMEAFPAAQGWAWDRHKTGGGFALPDEPAAFSVVAAQEYRFACALCGAEARVPGPHGGPHRIVRSFAPAPDGPPGAWRYRLEKHARAVWMDVSPAGYVADSAGIGFGPPVF